MLEIDQCHLIMYFLELSASSIVSFQHILHIKLLMSQLVYFVCYVKSQSCGYFAFMASPDKTLYTSLP